MSDFGNWGSGLVEWTEGDTAYISCVFSWQLGQAYQRAIWYTSLGYKVKAGGPAVTLNPSKINDVAEVSQDKVSALFRHNPDATFTTRGCVRKCGFCAVHRIEKDYIELEDWEPKPIICDNNFLACSRLHFDNAIDKLKSVKQIDINQGMDARLLTPYHASRLAELDMKCVRLAWDNVKTETEYKLAVQRLINAGFKSNVIRTYVLIGFQDTPDDAHYRLEEVRKLGALPNPMRYQPLDSECKNSFVGKNWTNALLNKYMRYYSRLNWFGGIPFSEYNTSGLSQIENSQDEFEFPT